MQRQHQHATDHRSKLNGELQRAGKFRVDAPQRLNSSAFGVVRGFGRGWWRLSDEQTFSEKVANHATTFSSRLRGLKSSETDPMWRAAQWGTSFFNASCP